MGRYVVAVALAAALSYPAGLLAGSRWVLPLLNAAPAYAAMVLLLVRGRRRDAVVVMLVWAATLAVVGTVTFAAWPRDPAPLILNGSAYRDEMFRWIRTGVGRESSPLQFLPQHALHLTAFVALSLATASAASIAMGAVLMNYMDFYVASLFRAGAPVWAVALFGWQPWAMCRVAAFSILGVALAEPLLHRVRRDGHRGLRDAKPWILIAAGLLLADAVLKTALAPLWGAILRRALPAG
jgi:hypothetical protein